MKKTISQLQQSVINGELVSRGYIHSSIFSDFYVQRGFHFLQSFRDISKSLQWSSKKSKIAAVFQVKSILGDEDQLVKHLDTLSEMKRIDLTRTLTKFMIPKLEDRNQINNVRLKMMKNLSDIEKIKPSDISLMNEMYSLLTFGESLNMNDAKKLKSSLTSLKKLMGNQQNLEQQQKRDKRKAYNQNLMVRDIIQFCLQRIYDPDVKLKAEQLLKSPKNKKWFGIRLYKLLIEKNWTVSNMKILCQQLAVVKKMNQVGQIKMRFIRPKINKIQAKIRAHLEMSTQGSSKDISHIVQYAQSNKIQKQDQMQLIEYSLNNQFMIQQDNSFNNIFFGSEADQFGLGSLI